MSDVSSATQTASLSFEQHEQALSTDAASATTLDNMLDEILSAQTAVSELDTKTADEDRLRSEATRGIRDCIDAINTARRAVAGGRKTETALIELRDAASRATELSDELEPYR